MDIQAGFTPNHQIDTDRDQYRNEIQTSERREVLSANIMSMSENVSHNLETNMRAFASSSSDD